MLSSGGENIVNGTKASILPNANLRWEESQQTDIGIDFGFLNNSLTFTIDYYKKKTNGMLMNMQVPAYVGESVPVGNVGKMENSGVEMEINYRHTFGDFSFGVGGNLTYLKNKLIDYGNAEGWANLDSFRAQALYPARKMVFLSPSSMDTRLMELSRIRLRLTNITQNTAEAISLMLFPAACVS